MKQRVLIVGTGSIAAEYAKVVRCQGHDVAVVGRSKESAEAFQRLSGEPAMFGGIEQWLEQKKADQFDAAIVAVTGDQLAVATSALLSAGVKRILTEKPGGADANEIRSLALKAQAVGATVLVAYNRRFYASTREAMRRIQDDGGPTSFLFEFTEWAHTIEPLVKPAIVKEQWLLHNSTHVIDLAFHLGGEPEILNGFAAGTLSWHKHAVYAGAGLTVAGVPFSYHANWAAPGRWGVEILTRQHRYYLRPLEQLVIQKIGTVQTELVPIDDGLDKEYKPGFYREVEAFLGDGAGLPSIEFVKNRLKWLDRIASGDAVF